MAGRGWLARLRSASLPRPRPASTLPPPVSRLEALSGSQSSVTAQSVQDFIENVYLT